MHRLVTNHPEYVHIAERRADLATAKRRAVAAGMAWDNARNAELAEHAAAVQRAIDRGNPPPPAPPEPQTAKPDVGSALNLIHGEEANLHEEEKKFLAKHAEELLEALAAEERQLAQRAAPAVARLRELTGEWGEVARTAHQLARVVGVVPPGTPTVTPATIAAGATYVPGVPEPVRVRDASEQNTDYQARMSAARDKLAAGRRIGARRR